MEAKDMSDDKILDMNDFKRIDGEVICTKPRKGKKSKASKKKETKVEAPIFVDYDDELSVEDEIIQLSELCEELELELISERSKSKTLEKMLNKVLKQLQMGNSDA